MNIQEAVNQVLEAYGDSEEYLRINEALYYLVDIMKEDDSDRIEKAVYEAKHPKTEIRDPYMSGYRDGWNGALREIGMIAGSQVIATLVNTTNALAKKL